MPISIVTLTSSFAVYRPQTGAFHIRTTNPPGWLMQPMSGPGHVPVNLSTAVRLLGMP